MRQLFDYLPPDDLPLADLHNLPAGCRVRVPFGAGRELVGVLISLTHETTVPETKLRKAFAVLDEQPVLPASSLQLCQWTAHYYHHALGEVLHAALPVALRKGLGLPERRVWRHTPEGKGLPETAIKRSPAQQLAHQHLLREKQLSPEQCVALGIKSSALQELKKKGLAQQVTLAWEIASPPQQVYAAPPQQLNDEQLHALDQVNLGAFASYLLEGTTGSGKTEVYLQLIGKALEAGRQALVLVPEIGLAPQTLARFRQRFSVAIAELHSSVSQGERLRDWHAAATGEARILIGTRLAVFTPMPDLGIIVVDEEHDASFKQNEGLRYSARDLAVVRASQAGIPVLLGSATPSLETLQNALSGRFVHLRLEQRAGGAQPPALQLVDMRLEKAEAGISYTSLDAIDACLSRGEQALVFINRRGFAPSLLCQDCGWSAQCRRCDAQMTLHLNPYRLHCHHCDYQTPTPKQCPGCLSDRLAPVGQGTERAEEVLQQRFSNFSVVRVDQDSMGHKQAMAQLSQRLAEGGPCLLVGTQMLAKGHHFAHLTLVVVVDTDQGLLSGDFRGPERMGQLITQVAGRAGRGALAGRVLLQSFRPEHPLLQCLVYEGYGAFSRQLLSERQLPGLPPYWAMALLRAEDKNPERPVEFLKEALQLARGLSPSSPSLQYLGPLPALMEKRNDLYRFQLQVRSRHKAVLQQVLGPLISALEKSPLGRRLRWSLDVDPQELT
jgi:primosomal protein N' (replication factor Y) (superfamily II helicase)